MDNVWLEHVADLNVDLLDVWRVKESFLLGIASRIISVGLQP